MLKEEMALLEEYYPPMEEYDPKLTKEDWKRFILEVEKPNHPSPMQMLKALLVLGGEASCKKLAQTFGGSVSRYVGCTVNLGKRVKSFFRLPSCFDGTKDRVYVIPFLGRDVKENGKWVYSYRLRPELQEALMEIDLSDVELYVTKLQEEDDSSCGYWFLNAKPKVWKMSGIAVGEVQAYTLYNENGNKRRIYRNFLEAKQGDIFVGYEASPVKKVVALGRVFAEQDGEKIYFEKTHDVNKPLTFSELCDTPELLEMEFFQNQQGSFFKLTKNEFECIMAMIREKNPTLDLSLDESENDDCTEKGATELPEEKKAVILTDGTEKTLRETTPYTMKDFLSEVYMGEGDFLTLVRLLKRKGNVILQGAPGVGKTYSARRLAYAMMGEKDDSRIALLQFHQNYAYEDFVEGYKPRGDSFGLEDGVFKRFCEQAKNDPQRDYFFIIDEINRGNLSKIFGELLMLIEKEYRKEEILLPYSKKLFGIPQNLYLIGMMNTADRSLAMIDYALRRRFSFFDVKPGFASEGFKTYQQALANDTLNNLIDAMALLNREIAEDSTLGDGFMIGHSYFCGMETCTPELLEDVVCYDILPMLREYWFDNKERFAYWESNLQSIVGAL